LSVVVSVVLPETPLMVTVAGSVLAVEFATNVSVLAVALVELKLAVTPLGSPDAESATLPLNPLDGVRVIVLVTCPPWTTLTLFGLADSVKLETVSVTVVVCVKLPEVPPTATVVEPVADVWVAVSVRLVLLVDGFGENTAVTPLGRPVAENKTLPLKPPNGVTVIVLNPCPPCGTFTPLGLADRVKPVRAVTVSVSAVVCVRWPEVPMTVTVATPVAAVSVAVSVRVVLLAEGLGLNVAVTPVGRPTAENVTFPLNPLYGVIVIALVLCPPCTKLKLLGEADNV
jgi:hypothetical protein